MWRPLVLIVALLALPGCQGTKGGIAATDPFFGRTRVEPPRTGSSQTRPGATNWPNAGAGQPAVGSGVTVTWPTSAGTQPGTVSQAATGQPGWTPAQSNAGGLSTTTPRPSNNGLAPPDGSLAFSNTSNAPSPAPSVAGPGDQIAIPSAARTLNERVQDSVTRSQATAPAGQGTTSTAQPSAVSGSGFGVPPTASISGPAGAAAGGTGLPGAGLSGREKIVRVIEPSSSATNRAPSYSPFPSNTAPSPLPQGANGSDKPVDIGDLPEARS